ncbi:acyltransferase family protein [Mucilaginibacter aquaedulcis]|uniref:acyltransferase family protein n=1 Tax=Mucilaginibacter aquaedulcis TaxID=1187081 RepID=UPI0025B4C120|nr:acyltransferase [Mucilaginibacter aquaedulcis]MDN3547636.1 acyltransferase [Mucilaginibacter aquaedulcis]
MSVVKPKEKRLEYLDSLRGLASVSVIISHFVLAYRIDLESRLVNYSPFHFFYDGFAAVSLFFILSGYVLTLSMERKPNLGLSEFYQKRIFRIMPAYIVTLCLSFLAYSFYKVQHTVPNTSSWINEFWSKPLNLYHFLKQLIFLSPGDNAELVPQNWSLGIEMLFSFLIPFLYLINKKTDWLHLLVFNVVLYFLFKVSVFIIHFSLGILLALYQKEIVGFFKSVKQRYKLIVIVVIWFLYTYRYTLPMYYYYYFRKQSLILGNDDLIWVITGLGAFFILAYCLSSDRLQKVLNMRPFVFIGKISYAIYLTHMIFVIFVTPFFISLLNNMGIVNKYVVWFSSLLAVLGLTFTVSYLLTTFVEIPLVKTGARFLKSKK